MKPLGLKGTYDSLRSANGTAQHLLLSIWGIVVLRFIPTMPVNEK
jgi:hypothetical protein